MILYNNKQFVTNSNYPNNDWTENADWVIPDNSELAQKIISLYPNFDFVLNDDGTKIIDVVATEPQPEPPAITQEQRMDAMENALEEIINIIMEG